MVTRMHTLLEIRKCEQDIGAAEQQIEEWTQHHRKRIKGTTGLAFLEERRSMLHERLEDLLAEWEGSASTDPRYPWMILLSDTPLENALKRIYLLEREKLELVLRKKGPVKRPQEELVLLRFPGENQNEYTKSL